jgi:hypothetical protein
LRARITSALLDHAGCQDRLHPAKYPATTCAEFLLSRFADTYAYRRELEAV